MEFALTEDQQLLQRNAREFFEGQGGIQPARKVMNGDTATSAAIWKRMAEVGFPGLTIPEEYGGAGQGFLSLVPVLEEAGRYLTPGPLTETVGFAVPVLLEHGTTAQKERFLSGIADGSERFSLAVHEPGRDVFAGDVQVGATRTDGGFTLSGTKYLVVDVENATRLMVLARTSQGVGGDGLTLFIVDPSDASVTIEHQRPIDETRPLATVTFNNTTVSDEDRIGPVDQGFAVADTGFEAMAAAITALAVGGLERCVDMSAEYAKTRVQFGQPIGRFQAIKHRIADMRIELEGARSLSYYAAWSVEERAPDRAVAVADAKAFALRAFLWSAAANIQNHGGIGFTWEVDAHMYLKRAKSWENYLGTQATTLEQLAAAQGW